jgi:predicted dehydrogenase
LSNLADSPLETVQTRRLRHAIIGVGAGILNAHRPALALPAVDLVSVSDINTTIGQQRADELQCAFYKDYRQMLAEMRPEVVVILTPPFLHASMTCESLLAGCHVLVEKPLAIQVAEADEMIETACRCRRLLGVVFQQRWRPEIVAARRLLQEGFLGNVQRVELTAVWTRPAAYYHMAPWRATWRGEGGGIVTNQSSHHLDLLCHLLGSPGRVFAWTRNLLHQIETEDTVQAMLEWPGGALGTVHISTAQADDPERLRIIGTRGTLEIGRGRLQACRLDLDMREYVRTCTQPYAQPGRHSSAVPLEQGKGDHVAVYRSFHDALLHAGSDYIDGAQGCRELELANALLYSSCRHCEVELPLNRQEYALLLKDLRAQSPYQGEDFL